MTSHPITPPPELVQQWINEEDGLTAGHIATAAARWGADQELEACCAEVLYFEGKALAKQIRAARRPEPPSLKEQALAALEDDDIDVYLIRRALEALPND